MAKLVLVTGGARSGKSRFAEGRVAELAPGGPWRMSEWVRTGHGPRLASAATWALVSVETEVEVGWSRLVTCTLDEVVVGDDPEPLVHRRGRYVPPGG